MAFNKVTLILGQRGSGKTTFITGNEELKIPSFFKLYIEKGMKVLIVDTIDHPTYRQMGIPFIKKEDLKRWKKGVYRIIINPYEIGEFCQLINSLPSMYNTFILWEDAKKHTRIKVHREMGTLIIDTKQKNIDMAFMYHDWMQAPDELYSLIDFINTCKTKGHPKDRKDSMSGYFEDAVKVWERVMKDKNPFANGLIDCGN